MLKIMLTFFILCDISVIAARNFAMRNIHLASDQLSEITKFNKTAGLILFTLLSILLYVQIKPKKDTWPKTPPK